MKPRPQLKNHVLGMTAAFSLLALAVGLAAVPQNFAANSRKSGGAPRRSLASAFGPMANLPSSINVASVVNTFQNPNSLLPLTGMVSEIQSRMRADIPAGTPVWDGHGELPGAVGTPGGFNPSFNLDLFSGCNIVPMTFYDVYLPSMNLPTVWCGAVSNQTQPAFAPSNVALPGSAPGNSSPRAVQLTAGSVL